MPPLYISCYGASQNACAACVTIAAYASDASNFVEIIPSPRNAETIESAPRDAKTVTTVHQVDRSFTRSGNRRRAAAARGTASVRRRLSACRWVSARHAPF